MKINNKILNTMVQYNKLKRNINNIKKFAWQKTEKF